MINYTQQTQLRFWERHQDFKRWQDMMTIKFIFGDKTPIRIPPLPREYAEAAKVWIVKNQYAYFDHDIDPDVSKLVDEMPMV